MTTYQANYERDSDGWLVTIPEIPGCHSDGETYLQAQRNIKEAAALCLDVDESEIEITDDLSDEMRHLLSSETNERRLFDPEGFEAQRRLSQLFQGERKLDLGANHGELLYPNKDLQELNAELLNQRNDRRLERAQFIERIKELEAEMEELRNPNR